MKKLIQIRLQIKDLQQKVAQGMYGRGRLTKIVNKINKLKSEEYNIINPQK